MILIIEDELSVAQMLKTAIEHISTYHIHIAITLSNALQAIKKHNYSVIICDLCLPDSKGEDTIRAVQKAANNIPIIVITGNASTCTYERAMFLGAQDLLEKGDVTTKEIVIAIRKAIARQLVRSQFKPIENDIFESEKLMRRFIRQIE